MPTQERLNMVEELLAGPLTDEQRTSLEFAKTYLGEPPKANKRIFLMQDIKRFGLLRQWAPRDQGLLLEGFVAKRGGCKDMAAEDFWQTSCLIIAAGEACVNLVANPVAKLLLQVLRKWWNSRPMAGPLLR